VNKGIETTTNRDIKRKLYELYEELLSHDGYGDLHLEIRLLRRGQKEVIIRCGKQYRYVISYPDRNVRGPDKIEGSAPSDKRFEDRRKNADRRQNHEIYRGIDRRKARRRAGELTD
jgi:hypothetical protein